MKRFTLPCFELVLHLHTSLRRYSRSEQKSRWLDILASFKIHAVQKKGFPDTIGKRQFLVILDVNEISIDIDFDKLTKDMRTHDKVCTKLHALLLDDPLVNSDRKARREALLKLQSSDKNKATETHILRMKKFREEMIAEENAVGIRVHPDRRERLKKKFEEKGL